MDRLESAFEDIFSRMGDTGELELSAAGISAPSSQYTANDLIITRSVHFYNAFRSDALVFVAEKSVFRRLALVMVAAMLHRVNAPVQIALMHPKCDFKALFVHVPNLDDYPFGVFWGSTRVEKLHWAYREMARHPWDCGRLPSNLHHLPHFALTDQADGQEFVVDYDARHYAKMGGGFESMDRVVDLLMNISDSRNNEVEFVLEAEPGFRGVAPASAEASFHLPGSIRWDYFRADLTP